MIDLRLGDWRTALADVVGDVLICDPPYGERTHKTNIDDVLNPVINAQGRVRSDGRYDPPRARRGLSYEWFTPELIEEFVSAWQGRIRGWWCVFSCSDLMIHWRRSLEGIGLYAFAPISCVSTGGSVRLAGDGPSSWTTYLNVARPRHDPWNKWGTLPGAYVSRGRDSDPLHRIGGKRLDLMSAIVRDYSRRGDLIVDPFAGSATTLIAASGLGRRAVGSEIDEEAWKVGMARIERGVQLELG